MSDFHHQNRNAEEKRRVRIEQCIAWSGTPETAAVQFRLPLMEVLRVWNAMEDTVNPVVKPGRPAAPCGTYAAYKRHIRRGETPDAQCKEARASETRERRHRSVGEAS